MAKNKTKTKQRPYDDILDELGIAIRRSEYNSFNQFCRRVNQRLKRKWSIYHINNIAAGRKGNKNIRRFIENFIWEHAPEDFERRYKFVTEDKVGLVTKDKLDFTEGGE